MKKAELPVKKSMTLMRFPLLHLMLPSVLCSLLSSEASTIANLISSWIISYSSYGLVLLSL